MLIKLDSIFLKKNSFRHQQTTWGLADWNCQSGIVRHPVSLFPSAWRLATEAAKGKRTAQEWWWFRRLVWLALHTYWKRESRPRSGTQQPKYPRRHKALTPTESCANFCMRISLFMGDSVLTCCEWQEYKSAVLLNGWCSGATHKTTMSYRSRIDC